jgi:hypothetical protein
LRGQRGIVTVIVAMLLISGALYVLLQSFGLIRSRSIDTAQTSNAAQALLLAESGLERAVAVVAPKMADGTALNTTCTGLVDGQSYSVGSRGSFTITAATSTPTTCGGTNDACTACNVTVKGVVGTTERVSALNMDFTDAIGITGRSATVSLVVKNTDTVRDAYAILDLTWRKLTRGGGQNSSDTYLTNCTSTSCTPTMLWDLNSASNSSQVKGGGIGSAILIPKNTPSGMTVTQIMNTARDYVEVGGLFPGTTTAPTPVLRASYWSDSGSSAGTWGGNADSTGQVKSGVASSTGTCLQGSTVPGAGAAVSGTNAQTCSNWCYDADTLVFGYSGQSNSIIDETTAVSFNSVPMTRLLHFPNTNGTIANATGRIYSEIWYRYNAPYNPSVPVPRETANFVTSYAGVVTGTSNGATLTMTNSGKIGNARTGTIASVVGSACVGDVVTGGSNVVSGTKISKLNNLASGCVSSSSSNVPIEIDQAPTSGNISSLSVPVTTLTPSATLKVLTQGQQATVLNPTDGTASQTINISLVNGGGTSYTISGATAPFATSSYVVQGNGTTITVPTTADLPATTGMVVNVYSKSTSPAGAGAFAANTTVTAIDTVNKTFTVSATPSTGLVGATVCGGSCALFNNPSSSSATTTFSLTKTTGTAQWSGGFVCLSGVDPTAISTVRSSTFRSRTWSETVQ